MQKDRFIPREKLGKKARRALDSRRRAGWGIAPATRRVESRKLYNRKRLRDRDDGAEPFVAPGFFYGIMNGTANQDRGRRKDNDPAG